MPTPAALPPPPTALSPARRLSALNTATSPSRRLSAQETGTKCPRCEKNVYNFEAVHVAGANWHPGCVRCKECKCSLTIKTAVAVKAELFCKVHVPKPQSVKANNKDVGGAPVSGQGEEILKESANPPEAYVPLAKFLQLEALVVSLQQRQAVLENLLQQVMALGYNASAKIDSAPPVAPNLVLHASNVTPRESVSTSDDEVINDKNFSPLIVSFSSQNAFLLGDREHTDVYTYDLTPADTPIEQKTKQAISDRHGSCEVIRGSSNSPELSPRGSIGGDNGASPRNSSSSNRSSSSSSGYASTKQLSPRFRFPVLVLARPSCSASPPSPSSKPESPQAASKRPPSPMRVASLSVGQQPLSSSPPFSTALSTSSSSRSSLSSSSLSSSLSSSSPPSSSTTSSPSLSISTLPLPTLTTAPTSTTTLTTTSPTISSTTIPTTTTAITTTTIVTIPPMPGYNPLDEATSSYTLPPTANNQVPSEKQEGTKMVQVEGLMYNNYLTQSEEDAEELHYYDTVAPVSPSSVETKYAYVPADTTDTTTSCSPPASTSTSVVPIAQELPAVSQEEMERNARFQKWTHRTLELWQYFAKRDLDPVAAELEPHRLSLLRGVCGHAKDYIHFTNGIPENAWQDRYYAATAAMSQRGLLGISRDLFKAVTTRARLILEEIHVPVHKKTIRAISAGGVAGGTKFFDNNILFKFPNDPRIGTGANSMHLYGGAEPDLERAAKAASNDLKGANALSNCWWNAYMPMVVMPQILVDYVGYRIIAMTWVDMSGAVLVSGSRDGGQTVVDTDDIARAALKYAAHHLHLAQHRVNDVMLYAAGDIEVHKNSDGRRYVLDLARTMPPEDPEQTRHLPYVRSSVFFRMHRPSFLTHLKSLNSPEFPPLSPDALSRWGAIGAQVHNAHVKRATNYLMNDRVRDLVCHLEKTETRWTRISAITQDWGISIRHLGLMRAVCREERLNPTTFPKGSSADDPTSSTPATNTPERAKRLQVLEDQLLLCMVARAGKNLLRQELRQALLSKHVKQTIVDFMNSLTRLDTSEHESFWSVKLPIDIAGRFGHLAIVDAEKVQLTLMCHAHIASITYYICSNTGIVLRPTVDWRSIGSPDFEFNTGMIQELCCRTKTLDFFEKFILEDLILQACESRTASEFVRYTMQMSQKKMPTLQLLDTLEAVVPPQRITAALDTLRTLLKTKVSTIDLQCLTLRALSLHFLGHTSALCQVIHRSVQQLDAAVFSLIRVLPQVYQRSECEALFTEALIIACRNQQNPAVDGLVSTLLVGKANCNARDVQTGETLLNICSKQNNTSLTQLLLNAKADPNLSDASSSAPFSVQPTLGEAAVSLPPETPALRTQPSEFLSLTAFQGAKLKFDAAAQLTKTFRNVTDERKLVLYGLFKQATMGDVQGPQPDKVPVKEALPGSYVETIQYEAWAKWNAWHSVHGMSKEAAMEAYALEVEKQKADEANPLKRPAPPPPRPQAIAAPS